MFIITPVEVHHQKPPEKKIFSIHQPIINQSNLLTTFQSSIKTWQIQYLTRDCFVIVVPNSTSERVCLQPASKPNRDCWIIYFVFITPLLWCLLMIAWVGNNAPMMGGENESFTYLKGTMASTATSQSWIINTSIVLRPTTQ